MYYSFNFGQILGIVVGVTVGGSLVHIVINALKPAPTPQMQYQHTNQMEQTSPLGLFDQVASNVKPSSTRWSVSSIYLFMRIYRQDNPVHNLIEVLRYNLTIVLVACFGFVLLKISSCYAF